MTLSVPEKIYATQQNVDIYSTREDKDQFLGHLELGVGYIVVDHFYYPSAEDTADAYFKVETGKVLADGKKEVGWVTGCDSYDWKIKFNFPPDDIPPVPTPTTSDEKYWTPLTRQELDLILKSRGG